MGGFGPDTLQEGTELLNYRIDAVLGQGSFGITYRAWDKKKNQTVAIKEYFPRNVALRQQHGDIHPRSNANEDTSLFAWGLDRFRNEVLILAKFRHPNIVPVLFFFDMHRTVYMVMPFVEGESLKEWRKNNPSPSEASLMGILMPLLDGLEAIHRDGYLHRDIKPENIFIQNNGKPVLLDFGAARQAIGVKTHKLTLLLTPGYAPVEQYSEQSNLQGPWSDIYAMGAVLYYMISGKSPPSSTDRLTAKVRHTQDPMISILKLGATRYSSNFLEAIDYALMIHRNHRPQNVADWRLALTGKAVPRNNLKPETEEQNKPLPNPRKKWLFAASAMVFLLAVMLHSEISHRFTDMMLGKQLASGTSQGENRPLSRKLAILHVTSQPQGAKVLLDGVPRGSTPFHHDTLEPGPHNLRLELAYHLPLEKEIFSEIGKEFKLDHTFIKGHGKLTVDTTPSGANLLLDGAPISEKTPLTLEKVAAGKHLLTIRMGTCHSQREVEVLPGTTVKEEIPLGDSHGNLRKEMCSQPPVIKDLTFISVPAGKFMMGSTHGQGDERPVHPVEISAFELGKHEVTQQQWQSVMGNNPSEFSSCGAKCPVERISWNDVQTFINKLNSQNDGCTYRLPTEAEWEYACRSENKEEKYCGGNEADLVAWYLENSGNKTHNVGRKTANSLGLHDMSGNVMEWTCSSWGRYDDNIKQHTLCSNQGSSMVARGGGWNGYPDEIRATLRDNFNPNHRNGRIGFRLARSCL